MSILRWLSALVILALAAYIGRQIGSTLDGRETDWIFVILAGVAAVAIYGATLAEHRRQTARHKDP